MDARMIEAVQQLARESREAAPPPAKVLADKPKGTPPMVNHAVFAQQAIERLTREPILIVLPRGVAVEKAGWMRLWSFSAGVEVAIVGRRVLWRRVPAVPKTRNAFEAARAAWETRHDGFRVWLSEPEQRVQFDAQQLETVLARALVQELVGKRRLERSRDA